VPELVGRVQLKEIGVQPGHQEHPALDVQGVLGTVARQDVRRRGGALRDHGLDFGGIGPNQREIIDNQAHGMEHAGVVPTGNHIARHACVETMVGIAERRRLKEDDRWLKAQRLIKKIIKPRMQYITRCLEHG
jgi:hypothetical protein